MLNRIALGGHPSYDIKHGRWISPDQARDPYWNLFDYVMGAATSKIDGTGLGITVNGDDEYKAAALAALSRLCPQASLTLGEDGGIKSQMPFACNEAVGPASDGPQIAGSGGLGELWKQQTHGVGCTLLAHLLCGCCNVVIEDGDSGNDPHYVPDDAARAMPKGTKTPGGFRGMPHAKNPINVDGNGCGSGGIARVSKTVLSNGVANMPQWVYDANSDSYVVSKTRVTYSGARLLAHELGHAANACLGDANFKVDNWDNVDLKYKGKAVGGISRPGDWSTPFGHDREEFDNVMYWENPIAEELGEEPRMTNGR